MPGIDFTDVLWKKQREYMEDLHSSNYWSRFKSFRNVFNYFEPGQTVAQIACGSINNDLFLTMDKVGKDGKIILIDEEPDFIYNRVSSIIGNLPKEKNFYIKTEEGKKQLQEMFSRANVEAYVQHLPPYPKQILDESLDHVMAINAAFELTAQRAGGPKANPEGIVVETYRKLKKGGSLIVQGLLLGDVDMFKRVVNEASEKNELDFKEEYELKFPPLERYGAGEWKRWVKFPSSCSKSSTEMGDKSY
jgi:hypothetical protein